MEVHAEMKFEDFYEMLYKDQSHKKNMDLLPTQLEKDSYARRVAYLIGVKLVQ